MMKIPAEPDAVSIDIRRSAVIVVDMQNSFCKEGFMMDRFGKLDAVQVEAVIEGCRGIIQTARKRKIAIVYLRMTYNLNGDNPGPDSPFYWKEKGLVAIRQNPELKERLLIEGTPGWQIIDELKPEPGDIIVNKGRYSGFINTNLDDRLREKNIKYLIFTGLYTNICVESTLRDAFSREYFNLLVKDACGAMGGEYMQEATLWNVKSAFGWVTSAADIVNNLQE